LTDRSFAYWALGHIHKCVILSENPSIVYPGSFLGCHRIDAGEIVCYLVLLTKEDTNLEFLKLVMIEFDYIKVELNEDDGIHELKYKINQLISKDTLELIHLTINSQTDEITE